MSTLIKIGGTLLDAAESRERLAREITQVVEDGLDVVVVHGGGKQMTRYLAERGIESQFVNGLRVTTPQVLEAVLKCWRVPSTKSWWQHSRRPVRWPWG